MVIHYKDIIEKTSECGGKGKSSLDLDVVTCIDCLELIKQEWERQVKGFTGQPKKNAERGLYETKKRIKERKR